MPTEWPRSGRCLPAPGQSRATKSVELSRICAEVPACFPHCSDQPGVSCMLVRGKYFVCGELPLHSPANEVGLAPSTALRSLSQPPSQLSGGPHRKTMCSHSLSDILADLSDNRRTLCFSAGHPPGHDLHSLQALVQAEDGACVPYTRTASSHSGRLSTSRGLLPSTGPMMPSRCIMSRIRAARP